MKTLYVFIFVLLFLASTHISAQCAASFSAATTTCCPNEWQFADSSHVSAGDSIISWNWDMPGGVPVSDSIQNAYTTYPALGFYSVCLTIITFNGCTDTNCQVINVTSLSVNENEHQPAFKIRPNPFSTQALIEVALPLSNASLSIYNSYGQCVALFEHLTEQGILLEREQFSSGIYFILLSDGPETRIEKLIVE